jgi:hypothetical protein
MRPLVIGPISKTGRLRLIPRQPRSRPLDRDAAEKLAIAGLSYLAGDPERLSRFLALSGLGPAQLRLAAAQPGFLAAVMAFLAGDEKTLLDFAAASGHAPEQIAAAHQILNPEPSGEFG